MHQDKYPISVVGYLVRFLRPTACLTFNHLTGVRFLTIRGHIECINDTKTIRMAWLGYV